MRGMVAYLVVKELRECGIPHERNVGKKPKYSLIEPGSKRLILQGYT
jgi:hypothetical protein